MCKTAPCNTRRVEPLAFKDVSDGQRLHPGILDAHLVHIASIGHEAPDVSFLSLAERVHDYKARHLSLVIVEHAAKLPNILDPHVPTAFDFDCHA